MANDVGIRIGVDGEKGFKDALSGINSQIRSLNSELKNITSAFDGMENSEEAVSAKTDALNRVIDANKQKIDLLENQYNSAKTKLNSLADELEKAKKEFGENSKEAIKAQNAYNRQVRAVNDLNRQLNDTNSSINKFERELKSIGKSADGMADKLEDAAESTGGFSDAFSGAFLGGAISGAIDTLISSVGNLVSETMEYRKILGTLEVSSQKAGYTTEQTAQTYEQLYSILGDDQTAATATANLQALGLSQEQLTQITDGAIGAWATYGDSIPIDGLAEAIKAGAVTGSFADVLNWAGTSEDAFNEKLASTTDPAERANMVLQELANQGLMETAEGWRQNNADIVAMNKASNDLNGTMAEFGELLSPIVVLAKEGFNALLESVLGIVNAFTEGGISAGILEIQNVFSNMFGSLQETLPQVLTNIFTNMQNAFPQLLTTIESYHGLITGAIADIFSQLGTYLKENLPSLISTGLTFLEGFSASLRENAGVLIESGLELITKLAEGIINSIPVLVEKVPTIVTNIANIINDNAPKILETGVNIIVKLVAGIIKAIPVIVQNLPKIIEAIVSVITAFNWLNLGKNIMTLFKDGIDKMVGAVKGSATNILNSIKNTLMNLPNTLKNIATQGVNGFVNAIKSLIGSITGTATSMSNAVINGIKTLPSKVSDIGKNVISGLTQGLKSGITNLTSTVGEIADSVINKFKAVFDIHSPSRVMKNEVGVMIGRGIAEGVKKTESYVANTAKKVLEVVTDEIEEVNKKIAIMQEEAEKEKADEELKTYKKRLEDKYKELEEAETEAKEKILEEIASIEEEWNKKQVEEAKTAEKEQLEARLDALNDFKDKYEKAIEDIKDKYKESYEDIQDEQNKMADKLKDYGELFEKVKTENGEIFELSDIQSDIDKIKAYGDALEELKDKGISDTLMLEIQGLNVDEALGYTQELLKLSDEEFENYMELWNEKQKEAQAVASKFYEEEFKLLDKEFMSKIPEEMSGLRDDMSTLGIDSALSLAEGFKSQYDYIERSFVSTIAEALRSAKEEMGVHSPSTVWAEFGGYLADGLDVGFVGRMKKVTQDINNSIPQSVDIATNSGLMRATENTLNGINLNNAMSTNTQPVVVKLMLDGREVAQSVFDPLKEVSKQRGVAFG